MKKDVKGAILLLVFTVGLSVFLMWIGWEGEAQYHENQTIPGVF